MGGCGGFLRVIFFGLCLDLNVSLMLQYAMGWSWSAKLN